MNEQQFQDQVDALFLQIEQWLEQADTVLDFETAQGILTITLPQASQLILSRQPSLQEVWLATPVGAYHFSYRQKWLTKKGEELISLLQEIIQQKANIILDPNTF
ncbi:MAG: iron donor protein CyaY [Proteobacteria bacterium]|nr:iron donor protein CyaY [Pseudomonadota bacterium]